MTQAADARRGRRPERAAGALEGAVRRAVIDLDPGYFALVMATGIVSIAAYLLAMPTIARLLLWFNLAAYGVLWLLTFLRLVWYPRRMGRDLTDHARGPGFFTVVAGTCVLGSQLVVLSGALEAAAWLWALGLVLWLILIYGFFTAITVQVRKPFLAAGINGSWLIAIVATQSVSILGSTLRELFGPWEEELLLFTLVMYLFGCMLYILIITLIFYRFTFFRLEPEDLTPPYWINMGAVAITTLAGASLLSASPAWRFLTDLAPFLKGFTLFFWATATWWIPLLFLLGAWRHLYRRVPLRYDPQYWGMVFPLGMYTVCTFQLGRAAELPALLPLAGGFVYVALAAWAATFLGLLYALFSGGTETPEARPRGGEASRGSGGRLTSLLVHCPAHGVEAVVRVHRGAGGGPEGVERCSLFPGRRDDVPCEGQCVTAGIEEPATSERTGERGRREGDGSSGGSFLTAERGT